MAFNEVGVAMLPVSDPHGPLGEPVLYISAILDHESETMDISLESVWTNDSIMDWPVELDLSDGFVWDVKADSAMLYTYLERFAEAIQVKLQDLIDSNDWVLKVDFLNDLQDIRKRLYGFNPQFSMKLLKHWKK